MNAINVFIIKKIVWLRYVFAFLSILMLTLILLAICTDTLTVYAQYTVFAVFVSLCIGTLVAIYSYAYLRDEVYLEAFDLKINQKERIDETREKALWFPIALTFSLMFGFLTMGINTPFTSKDDIFMVKGKVVDEFTLVNPFSHKDLQVIGPKTPRTSTVTKR